MDSAVFLIMFKILFPVIIIAALFQLFLNGIAAFASWVGEMVIRLLDLAAQAGWFLLSALPFVAVVFVLIIAAGAFAKSKAEAYGLRVFIVLAALTSFAFLKGAPEAFPVAWMVLSVSAVLSFMVAGLIIFTGRVKKA